MFQAQSLLSPLPAFNLYRQSKALCHNVSTQKYRSASMLILVQLILSPCSASQTSRRRYVPRKTRRTRLQLLTCTSPGWSSFRCKHFVLQITGRLSSHSSMSRLISYSLVSMSATNGAAMRIRESISASPIPRGCNDQPISSLCRGAIPLMLSSTILHSLISQSIFIVNTKTYLPPADGMHTTDLQGDVANFITTGGNCVGILTCKSASDKSVTNARNMKLI